MKRGRVDGEEIPQSWEKADSGFAARCHVEETRMAAASGSCCCPHETLSIGSRGGEADLKGTPPRVVGGKVG